MSSLQDLLAQEGFWGHKLRNQSKPTNHEDCRRGVVSEEAVPAAISLCHERKSVDLPGGLRRPELPLRRNGSSSFSSGRAGTDEPAAAKAIVSVLSGYVGRFSKDAAFRRRMRERCSACLAVARRKVGAAHAAVLVNLETAMDGIERLANHLGGSRDSKIRSLGTSIGLLSVVASLSSPKSRDGYTCGVPNSHLSACAQLYLAVAYKMERDDRVAARHLLLVFCHAPRLARQSLLPDLWEHVFLPHLLHLQVWYNREVEAASRLGAGNDREQRTKALNEVYDDQMDVGTAQFALYYTGWLEVGAGAPVIPSVSLPPAPRRRCVPVMPQSTNRSLYGVVLGPSRERDEGEVGVPASLRFLDAEIEGGTEEGSSKHGNPVHSDMGVRQRPSHPAKENPTPESASTTRKSHSFRLFSCQSDPKKGAILPSHIPKAGANRDTPPVDFGQAVALISSSESLAERESAIRVVAKALLDSRGDPTVQTAVSNASVVEGLLEVSFTSGDDEVVESIICILAELVSTSEANRQTVLNADPQLEIFLKLLGIPRLFLKVAVLLYLLKPKAKQMLSVDWVPLVLRILECGDQKQALFNVRCRAKFAAFYFLHQLLTGFDVDRNVENAKQVVSLGGLRMLIQRLEMGDARERKNVASLLTTCVRADGSCRAYLATNIKKASILELLLGNQLKSNGCALSLLVELVKLSRRTRITTFLNGLRNEGSLNAMHILLVYLQQAPAEQRPLVAAILLQLDLLGDTLHYSVYREEGIDALVTAMDCNLSKKIQENCSKALSILGGRFSSTGETTIGAWLLKRAGFDDGPTHAFSSNEIEADEITHLGEEEVAEENWQRRLAIILLSRGNKQFLTSLSNCMADGIPSLAWSCLVTVAWMSITLSLLPSNSSLWSSASSCLMPQLLDRLNYNKAIEERVLASFSLLNLSRNSDCRSKLLPLDKQITALLHDLAQVTWTAREIILIETNNPISFIKL